jgi:hypothetical protein
MNKHQDGPMTKRLIFIQFFFFVVILFACKSNSTSPAPPENSGPPKVSLSCSPTSGGTTAVVSVTVSMKNNQSEIKSFGCEISFNTTMFNFQSVSGGNLTAGWATVDGNETVQGTVRIGAFAGSGPSIQIDSNGALAVAKFEVTCSSCSNGQQSQFCFTNLFDDIAGMGQDPSCVTFTFTK